MSQVAKKTENEIEAQVAGYMNAPYIHMIIPTAEGRYLAEVLELPGCITDGRTPEEAYSNLKEAMSGYLSSLVDRDMPVPEAIGLKEMSGNIPLRISSELHRMAALRAKQEGISLNQWIGKAIAMQATGESLAERIAESLASKMAGGIQLSATIDATVNMTTGPQGAWSMLRGGEIAIDEMTGSQALVYPQALEKGGMPLNLIMTQGIGSGSQKPRASRSLARRRR